MEPRGVWEVRRVVVAIAKGIIDGLAILAIMAVLGCDGQINLFGSPTQVQGLPAASPSPTASPSPSASATPSATPESCAIEYMILQPRDGLTLAKDAQGRVSLTPYQTVRNPDGSIAQREVSEACNLPRIPSIIWTSSSAAVRIGTGFEPIVTRVGVGEALVTATLEGKVSNAVVIR